MHDLLCLDHSVFYTGIYLFDFSFIISDLNFQFGDPYFKFFDLGFQTVNFTLKTGSLVRIFFSQSDGCISVALRISDLIFDIFQT